jgi:hypothetical protein
MLAWASSRHALITLADIDSNGQFEVLDLDCDGRPEILNTVFSYWEGPSAPMESVWQLKKRKHGWRYVLQKSPASIFQRKCA